MTLKSFEAAFGNLVRAAASAPTNLVTETDRFHMVRIKTLSLLSDLTPEQGDWQPREGKWSIAQISDHLLRSEESIQEQFRRLIAMARAGDFSAFRIGLRDADTSMAGIPRDVMQMFEAPIRVFNMFMPHAVRETIIRNPIVPALNPKGADPRPDITIGQVRSGLAQALADTEAILRAPMPAGVERPTIDHPMMGNNNILQLTRIMTAHEERHQGQISEMRGNPGFPGN